MFPHPRPAFASHCCAGRGEQKVPLPFWERDAEGRVRGKKAHAHKICHSPAYTSRISTAIGSMSPVSRVERLKTVSPRHRQFHGKWRGAAYPVKYTEHPLLYHNEAASFFCYPFDGFHHLFENRFIFKIQHFTRNIAQFFFGQIHPFIHQQNQIAAVGRADFVQFAA